MTVLLRFMLTHDSSPTERVSLRASPHTCTADIPDIGDSGLAQAYTAWKSVTKSSNTKELRLPGLDYTSEQLFFLSFARIWAQLTRPATAVSRIRTDPHSPPYWRATGTLRNLDVFHKAFGCKAGSRVSLVKSEWSGC
jgi:endothelin-converting enzyme